MSENNKIVSIDKNIKIGSLVYLKTREFELQQTNQTLNIIGKKPKISKWKQIDNGLITLKSPIMVVTEIVQEEKQQKDANTYNSSTGKQTNFERQIKVKCMWYSVSEGKFEKEQWFPIELLHEKPLEQSKQTLKLGDIVSLKTYLVESSKIENGTELRDGGTTIIDKDVENSLDFCPPIMAISQIFYEQQKQPLPLYSKKTGKLIREITKEDYIIKCVFFNSKKQNFTHETFIAESLIAIPINTLSAKKL